MTGYRLGVLYGAMVSRSRAAEAWAEADRIEATALHDGVLDALKKSGWIVDIDDSETDVGVLGRRDDTQRAAGPSQKIDEPEIQPKKAVRSPHRRVDAGIGVIGGVVLDLTIEQQAGLVTSELRPQGHASAEND